MHTGKLHCRGNTYQTCTVSRIWNMNRSNVLATSPICSPQTEWLVARSMDQIMKNIIKASKSPRTARFAGSVESANAMYRTRSIACMKQSKPNANFTDWTLWSTDMTFSQIDQSFSRKQTIFAFYKARRPRRVRKKCHKKWNVPFLDGTLSAVSTPTF